MSMKSHDGLQQNDHLLIIYGNINNPPSPHQKLSQHRRTVRTQRLILELLYTTVCFV